MRSIIAAAVLVVGVALMAAPASADPADPNNFGQCAHLFGGPPLPPGHPGNAGPATVDANGNVHTPNGRPGPFFVACSD